MSTTANLLLGDKAFNAGHDGSPWNIIPDIIEIAEKAQNNEAYFEGLLLDDWLATGYGWCPGEIMLADYEYRIDLEKREIKWIDNGKIRITVNYQIRTIKFADERESSYRTLDELSELIYAYCETI